MNAIIKDLIQEIYKNELTTIYNSYSDLDKIKLKDLYEKNLKMTINIKTPVKCYLCKKPKHTDSIFCKIHDKKHNFINVPISDYSDYIQLKIVNLNDTTYLQDSLGLLYDPDKHNLIGRYQNNTIYKFC